MIVTMADKENMERNVTDKKRRFINQLQSTYKDLYNKLRPLPGLREKDYSVDSVFVEGGIERLDDTVGRASWIPVESHYHWLSDQKLRTKKRILEAEAGYGKTTLTLQLAYEWCNHVHNSSIKDDYEIFILLKMRQLVSVPSFLDAIKASLLPQKFDVTSRDIGVILDTARSVLVILDDIDEYLDNEKCISDNILTIVDRYPRLEMILTTRSYANANEPMTSGSKRVRLTGFCADAQDKYLRKVFLNSANPEIDRVKYVIGYNPILRDIFQVPLYFTLFTHFSQTMKELVAYKSVTSFFSHFIDSLHIRANLEIDQVELRKLNKIAFESLSGKSRKRSWKKDELLQQIGEEALEHFLETGILQEEPGLQFSDEPLSSSGRDDSKADKRVRYYHDLFCEWHAAQYLVEVLTSTDSQHDVIDMLDELDHVSLQYVYRFACGINSSAANYIINYFRNLNRRQEIIIMCTLEQSGSVDSILDVVEDICSQFLQISTNNTRSLNKATIQLLETASSNEIKISSLLLSDCFLAVDKSSSILVLSSGLQLPALSTLHELHITQTGREFTEDDMSDIFIYVCKCIKLKTLKFTDCLFPLVYKHKNHLTKLQERGVKVLWYPLISWYRLNLKSGYWQEKKGTSVLQENDYQRKVLTFREMYKEF